MRRPVTLAVLALLAGCGDQDPLTVSVGNRVVYSEASAAQAVAGTPAVAGAPAVEGAPVQPAASSPFRMPTITANVPVFIGDRQVGGPVAPAAP